MIYIEMVKITTTKPLNQNRMTPEEKAKELVDKMYLVDDPIGNYPMCFDTAKECAFIAVDEMLKHMSFHFGQIGLSTLEYWNQVKQEIQRL